MVDIIRRSITPSERENRTDTSNQMSRTLNLITPLLVPKTLMTDRQE
jgi:hypothetical protein